MGKSKKELTNEISKFDGFGVDFKCKLIGFCDVATSRGDDVCQQAMNKLKQYALKMNKEKREHKQRITVNITLKGIRLLDEQTEKIIHAHPIQRISFISHDSDDKRTFGYIVGTKDGYKLFAIRTPKEAELITKTLKELFQEVFDRYKNSKEAGTESSTSEEKAIEPVNEVLEHDDNFAKTENGTEGALLNWDTLNDQIQFMQADSFVGEDSLVTSSNFQIQKPTPNPFEDDNFVFKPEESVDLFGSPPLFVDTTKAKTNNSASDDLFTLIAPPSTPQKHFQDEVIDAPLLISDPFAELKKNIDEMHRQHTFYQQPNTYGYQGAFPIGKVAYTHYQQTGIPVPVPNNLYQQPQLAVNNPFGATANFGTPNVSPHRPATNNPFFQQSQNFTQEDNSGWTVTRPTPAPRQDVKKSQLNTSDPFAFLNNQTGLKGSGSSTSPKLLNESSTPKNDLFDLLG